MPNPDKHLIYRADYNVTSTTNNILDNNQSLRAEYCDTDAAVTANISTPNVSAFSVMTTIYHIAPFSDTPEDPSKFLSTITSDKPVEDPTSVLDSAPSDYPRSEPSILI